MRHALRPYITVLLLIALSSCTTRKPERKIHEIAKITFASGGCYGTCPFLAIEVDSSLHYQFYGGTFTEKQGYYTGKISADLWDSINFQFEKIHFKELDSSYETSVDDLSTLTSIYYGAKKKMIIAQSASLPIAVDSVLNWLMYSYRRVQLNPSIDTAGFYARAQYPPPPPPPPPPAHPQ